MAGLYIHIPFCATRCIYCGFYSTTNINLQDTYIKALCREIEIKSLQFQTDVIDTIYIGGGTPSLLSIKNLEILLEQIFKKFNISTNNPEITIECNPDDVNKSFAKDISKLPINRVSMGAQSFSNKRLQFLHRRHQSEDIFSAIYHLRENGIQNISLDLIFGFPNQTLEEWEKDINSLIELRVEHASTYSLTYEEGTMLDKMRQTHKIKEVDEELSISMYNMLTLKLIEIGYEHYEISNFSLPGFRSRHNSNYWNGTAYIGIGAAAHSYYGDKRFWNISNIHKYITSIEKGTIPFEEEIIDDRTKYNDIITTALRTKEGINLNNLQPKHKKFLLSSAKTFIEDDLLTLEKDRLHLTHKGIFISDNIMSNLILLEEDCKKI